MEVTKEEVGRRSSGGERKRPRTAFTKEQLRRLQAEFKSSP